MFDLLIDAGAARLTLDRPAARNAIPVAGWLELANAIEEVDRSDARLLILCGAGGAFCSGADLGDFDLMRERPDDRSGFRRAMRNALDRFADLGIPSLAVVEGACYGAGLAVAMACDIRFAGADARFAVTPAKLGISYPQEDIHRLVALVGPGQAARLLLGAQSIDAAEAERIGLVEHHFANDIDEAVAAFADAVRANDPASLATLKRGLGLAAAGKAQDSEQDRIFDELLGGEALARRLEAHRTRRAR